MEEKLNELIEKTAQALIAHLDANRKIDADYLAGVNALTKLISIRASRKIRPPFSLRRHK